MADLRTKTTSSNLLNTTENDQRASPSTPKGGEAQILTRLAHNLSESYQMVKQRQQKFLELSRPRSTTTEIRSKSGVQHEDSASSGSGSGSGSGGEWQEVLNKNKLKRKKKLSTSLTSVTDSVNQEKRTRIEGIQLNCRGKLNLSEPSTPTAHNSYTRIPDRVLAKPPVPPAALSRAHIGGIQESNAKVLPPRLKRKLQENIQTIQKLNALTEQLRLEINELKSSLSTERGAVRVLRAQNESETRKWKNEVKKLQGLLEQFKKSGAAASIVETAHVKKDELPTSPISAATALANYEIQRLNNEINVLKEANKTLEDKKLINCDADRRKAADMRTMKDSYEIRLTQTQKSAKIEISRLLEELKVKERNIGQLKRDLQLLQEKPPQEATTANSRNATNKSTTNKTTNKKEKKTNSTSTSTSKSKKPATLDRKGSDMPEQNPLPSDQTQHPEQVQKLKNIELIADPRDLHSNVSYTTTKTFNISQDYMRAKPSATAKAPLTLVVKNAATEGVAGTTATTTAACVAHPKDFETLQREERLRDTVDAKAEHNENEFRAKQDHHSDSDSAVSSAPPSISPQPPPAGMDAADIWQTIRTYTTDIEKLQKELEMLQKENESLHAELNMAKEQILESEKNMRQINNSSPVQQLRERIHELNEECSELREQNELLEFRVLELEETTDKWTTHSQPVPVAAPVASITQANAKDVWGGGHKTSTPREDPMQLLFGGSSGTNDSGITSPHSQHHLEDEYNSLHDGQQDEIRRRLGVMLRNSALRLGEEEKQCLQQVIQLLQQIDLMSPSASGPDSLNTTASSSSSSSSTTASSSTGDEPSSLELVKSRVSDYSSAPSSPWSGRSPKSSGQNSNSRIVATVQPYNSSTAHTGPKPALHQQQQQQQQQRSTQHHYQPGTGSGGSESAFGAGAGAAPTNTPNDSPRRLRQSWQCNSSLSESGVFVESDFLSDISENNVCTQTEFEDEHEHEHEHEDAILAAGAKDYCNEFERLQRHSYQVPAHSIPHHSQFTAQPTHSHPHPHRHLHAPTEVAIRQLQYYKERLELLERKVLIYESSGDIQAKRLADRLQREIQLEKELKELRDRVDFLECENSTLEEEKCEFEEAENDTRLRLQRLEVELEVLSQRNAELEMTREALSAKYKDCRSECLILREDLTVSERQIHNIEQDKLRAKENLEFLHKLLPIFVFYQRAIDAPHCAESQIGIDIDIAREGGDCTRMGNIESVAGANCNVPARPMPCTSSAISAPSATDTNCSNVCPQVELNYLKEEVKYLRTQIKDLNSRHFEALESADSHWVDLEREYKEREQAFRTKEACLKNKIQKLQDCLRDDARAAEEKITHMEETEEELKNCLLRISKEHRDLLEKHQNLLLEYDMLKEQYDQVHQQMKPNCEALDTERKQNKCLTDELNFMRKLQQESDARNIAELEATRSQMYELRRESLHLEVANNELKEEIASLHQAMEAMGETAKEYEDKIRTLCDEVRTKDEMIQRLEARLERAEGFSLAEELDGSPSKRLKREEIKDLKTASKALSGALRNFKDCNEVLPAAHQFQNVARNVKKLADKLLNEEEDEIVKQIESQINEKLMKFHRRKMESEFYCTVYYPVRRTIPLQDYLLKYQTLN